MSNAAITIEQLWKRFEIGKSRSASIRESIENFYKRGKKEFFWALSDVNLEISKGEAVGVIGKNGAGKSTLLKLLSRITYPTRGSITIDGNVSSLLEVGTGFHPELTGRQNIFLNGTILGMSRKEVRKRFDEIVSFSGVEQFIDTPIKHYSSGMKVRLAFSVAAHLEPEILIIDEVLAVGDADFQRKCLGKMEDVTSQGRTVLFVSHNMDAVSSLCSRVVHLQKGAIINDSENVKMAIQNYLNNSSDGEQVEVCKIEVGEENEYYCINEFLLTDGQGNAHQSVIHYDLPMEIVIRGRLFKEDPALNIGYLVYNENGDLIFWSWFQNSFLITDKAKVGDTFTLKSMIPSQYLTSGVYRIEWASVIHNVKTLKSKGEGPFINFEVTGGDKSVMVNPQFKWN